METTAKLPAKRNGYYRYVPASPEAREWGAYVVTAGYAQVKPHTAYPPAGHPEDHQFTWSKGRVLTAFQFVYVARGGGEFESAASGRMRVAAGDLVVLFPNIWHRYRPDADTGWDEYWIEFDGEHMRRLMQRPEFQPAKPVLNLGSTPELIQAILTTCAILRREPAGSAFLLGAQAIHTLALTLAALRQQDPDARTPEEIIREAKDAMAQPGNGKIPVDEIARRNGMSPSSFRRIFKAQTGFAPHQFATQVTLKRATDLLRNTSWPVSRISKELGFSSIFYFSRFIKQHAGVSPVKLRRGPEAPAGAQPVP